MVCDGLEVGQSKCAVKDTEQSGHKPQQMDLGALSWEATTFEDPSGGLGRLSFAP